MSAQKCQAISKTNNRPCKIPRLVDGKFCRNHSPEWADWRQQNASKAGKANKALRLDMKSWKARSPEDMKKLIARIIEEVAQGKQELTPTMLRLLPTYIRLYNDTHEDTTEKRLQVLETLQQKQSK